jgi:hypothetical protein
MDTRVRAALHLILTPLVFAFGWAMLSGAVNAPWSVRALGWLAAVAGGAAYGWKNRHR